ncbi:hypothetical protein E4T39_02271 [Aureobasidium subglaciale]|nr:hypothetical protein E4T39_02271 [Aureobasidium subglaciale]
MKTSVIFSSLALALPAFAAPVTTSAAPIATPQNQCQVDYNNCLAIGTPEVMCSCDMTACFGEDAARLREWCASKTSGLTSGTATATATATPSATASGCVAKDNECRASDPVTGLSANQAQCSADNAACQGDCYDAYNKCRSAPDANMSTCASKYAGCLGQNPFDESGSLTIKPIVARAAATPAPSNCVAKDNACRQSDPVTGQPANQAFCSSENAACKGACEESYDACRGAPDANMSYCASLYAGCLGTNPFEKRAAPTGAFGGVAIHSGSEIQYASVNAAGSQFWLQKDTATFCPEISGLVCPNTTATQFLGGDNTLSLDTTVPGGQQVYVAADGRLSFTVAHSASTGEGSSVTGFSLAQEGQHIQFNGSDFLACPVDDAYAVFAAAAVKDAAEDCVGFAFRVAESTGPAAWQYS